MHKLILGVATLTLLSVLAAAAPAKAAGVIVGPYGGRVVYGPYVPYRHYGAYPHLHGPAYVARGPRCWRSARVRADGALVYRRVCI
jgi:hypothetical protein